MLLLLFSYVGAFGNADPLDASQWFQLAQQSAVPLVSNRRWSESSSTCSAMITGQKTSLELDLLFDVSYYLICREGVHYKFLVVYTGEKKHPQNKIVSAAVEFATSNLNMR